MADVKKRNMSQSRTTKRTPAAVDTSDTSLTTMLERLRGAVNSDEIQQLSDQVERIIFDKQFANG